MLKKLKTEQLLIVVLFFLTLSYVFTHIIALFNSCGMENDGTCTFSYNLIDVLGGMVAAFFICVVIAGLLEDSKNATVIKLGKKTTSKKKK